MDRARVREIFADAWEAEPARRRSMVELLCAGDRELRAEVLRLLGVLEGAGEYLAAPTIGPEKLPEPAEGILPSETQIGPYKLLERIGEGGFGEVFMAEQSAPMRRRVAIKIIKPGMDSRQVVARFEAERQALAVMEHPNIARVFDAGTTAKGRPYFVMELVKGVSITRYCDENRLTPRERLELLMPVCKAVQHAHSKGVIHRDIKPGNVLVTLHDGVPVPKVIDFGVAKAIFQPLTDKTLFTEFRQLVGTPAYMSPEQAEMSGLDVDTRSDIYALGVLLYELLTGSTPFDTTRLLHAGLAEIQRIIREEEPPKPSTRLTRLGATLTSVADRRRTEPERLGKLVRGELDWIVMRALEKDRRRRYATADAMAADLQKFLAGQPIDAAPPSRAYRARKFVRRNKLVVGSLCMVFMALALGLAVAVWGFWSASNERDLKEAARKGEADQRAEAELQKGLAEKKSAESRRLAYSASIAAGQSALRAGDAAEAGIRLTDAPPELRGWEWRYLSFLADPLFETIHELRGYQLCSSANRRWLAAGAPEDPSVHVYDLLSLRKESSTYVGAGSKWAMPSDVGDKLSVYRRDSQMLEMWLVGAPQPLWRRAAGPISGEFVGSGLVAMDIDPAFGLDVLADAATGRDVRAYPKGLKAEFGGTKFISADAVHDVATDRVVGAGFAGINLDQVVLSPSGFNAVAVSRSADSNMLLRLTDRSGTQVVKDLMIAWARQGAIGFRRDGEKLFIDAWSDLRLVDPALPLEYTSLTLPGRVKNVFAGPDGSPWLFVELNDRFGVIPAYGTSMPWRFTAPFQSKLSARELAISADGSMLAAAEWGVISLWDVRTGLPMWRKSTWSTFLRSVAFSADGTKLAAHTPRGTVTVFESQTGRAVGSSTADEGRVFTGLAFSPAGEWLYAGDDRGNLVAMDCHNLTGEPRILPGHSCAIEKLDASACGRWLVSISQSQGAWTGERTRGVPAKPETSVRLLDLGDGGSRALALNDQVPTCVAFSRDGTSMVVGTASGEILIFDSLPALEPRTVVAARESIVSLAWSHDQTRLAVGAGDTIHLLDSSDWQEVCALPSQRTSRMGFGADDAWLVACGWVSADVFELRWPTLDVLRKRDIGGLALKWLQSLWAYEWTADTTRDAVNADAVRSAEVRGEALRLIGLLGNNGPQLNNAALITMLDSAADRAALEASERGVRAAIAEAPEAPNFRFTLTRLLMRLGRWDEAERALQTAVQLFDGLVTAPPADAMLYMAVIYEHQGKHDEACDLLARYEDAIKSQKAAPGRLEEEDLRFLRSVCGKESTHAPTGSR